MSDKETDDVGTPEPATEAADESPDSSGSSGAEEGLSPWSPESYDPDAEGPTTSTEGS